MRQSSEEITIGFIPALVSTFLTRRVAGNVEIETRRDGRLLLTVQTVMGPFSGWALPSSGVERSRVTRQLTYAGFRSPEAMLVFHSIKLGLMLVLPVVVLIVVQWIPSVTTTKVFLYMVIAAGIGMLAPSSVLDRLVERRLRVLRHGFPDALDLLVVCVESGLGLSAAIQRVADEIVGEQVHVQGVFVERRREHRGGSADV